MQSSLDETQSRLGEIQADDGKVRTTALNLPVIAEEVEPLLTEAVVQIVESTGSDQVVLVNAAGDAKVAELEAVINSQNAIDAINARDDAEIAAAAAALSASSAESYASASQSSSIQAEQAKNTAIVYAGNAQASAESILSANYAPGNHSHPINKVVGLQDALNSKYAASNPAGYIPDAPFNGSAYVRRDGAWEVKEDGSFLPLSGGVMTGPIYFDGTSGQFIGKGTFDTSRGGNYGISMVCSVGYEFNWQAGWLTTTNQGSSTGRPLYLDSLAGTTLRVWDSSTDNGSELTHNGLTFYNGVGNMNVFYYGIQFPDSTVQTTAWTGVVDGYRALTDYDFTNVADTRLDTFGLTLAPVTGTPANVYDSLIDSEKFRISYDFTQGGTVVGNRYYTQLSEQSLVQKFETLVDYGDGIEIGSQGGFRLSYDQGLRFINWDESVTGSTVRYQPTSIVFGDTTTQTTAFPGFNNAALTGNPTAPTPATADNDTSIATTAFVKAQGYATTASPTFTGTPSLPTGTIGVTQTAGDNSTKLATTAFVKGQSYATTSALAAYAPLGGATFTGSIICPNVSGVSGSQISGQTYVTYSTGLSGYSRVLEHRTDNTAPEGEGDNSYVDYSNYTNLSAGSLSLSDYTFSGPGSGDIVTEKTINLNLSGLSFSMGNGTTSCGLTTASLSLYDAGNGSSVGLDAVNGLSINNGSSTMSYAPTGITFPDNTVQTTAAVSFDPAAIPAFATDVEARTSTNTTTTLSPSSAIWQRMSASFLELIRGGFGYAAVGTMGTFISGGVGSRMVLGTAGACSGRLRVFGASQVDQTASMMSTTFNYINFSKPIYCSGRAWSESTITDPNVTAAWYFGKSEANGAGDLNRKGFGWEIIGNATTRYLTLVVHDGTTLTKVTSSYVVIGGFAGAVIFEWDVVSDGAGNVTLYVNGASVATTALGPVGDANYSGTRPVIWQEELRATAATSAFGFYWSRGRIYSAI